MALLTSMGKVGHVISADTTHHRTHSKKQLKTYRSQVQEVLSGLNSESPKNGSRECGNHMIHYMIHEDFAYLILCEKSLSETDAFDRLNDLIQFKASFSQNNTGNDFIYTTAPRDGKGMIRVRKNAFLSLDQRMLDQFYPPIQTHKVITPQFISSDVDVSDSDSEGPGVKKSRADSSSQSQRKEKNYKYLCSECGFRTMHRFSLNRHLRKVNCTVTKEGTLKCPENDCESYSVKWKDLEDHMSKHHGTQFEVETKEFKDEKEFDEFLIDTQRKTHSTYVLGGGRTDKSFYMYCSRSRQTPRYAWTGKRNQKESKKSDKLCTSRMKVKFLEGNGRGRVRVEYHKTHFGHPIEVRRVGIPMPDRVRIAGMLKDGVPKEDVMNTIRAENCGEVNRLSLIDRQDVDNIIKQFKLGNGLRYRAEGKKGHSRRPKVKVVPDSVPVRLGFEEDENMPNYDQDHYSEIEIEQEFINPEEVQNTDTDPLPTSLPILPLESTMAEIRSLFSTAYGLVQSQNDAEVVKNAVETAIALLRSNHSHNGQMSQLDSTELEKKIMNEPPQL